LSELYGYSTPLTTFLVNDECSLHRPVLILQPTVNPRASNIESEHVRTILVSWEKDTVTGSGDIYMCLGGGGGTFRPLNESLTFKSPDA